MAERLYLLLEIVAYLLVINDVYGRRFQLKFPEIVTISLEIIVFKCINDGVVSPVFMIIPYIALFIYCLVEFRLGVKQTLVNMLLTFLAIGIVQIAGGVVSFFIADPVLCAFVVNLITFMIIVLLTRKNIFHAAICYVQEKNKMLFRIILNCCILFLLTMLYLNIKGSFSVFEYVMLIAFYLLLVSLSMVWKKEHERLLYKDSELALFRQYQHNEQDLYQDIRKKQHELKNQLNALYSTHYTCATYEELMETQRKYADHLKRDNQYTDLLLACKPSILAGFIYEKIKNADEQGISVEYLVRVSEIENTDMEYDLICIFGVLFDNAVEAVKHYSIEEQKINLHLEHNGEKTQITVKNVSEYIKEEDIRKWFLDAFSTKGENRGYGLSNVNELKKKYQADVLVKNSKEEGKQWLSISFIMEKHPKKQ